ncbi:creatininase family protein [Bombella pollinis]|uniref:Creatininase family protein n=1 Tax=Bombella pollinis TaxID=2967337 RepID=A0ABT3WL47_9PROT|nr:creatininase family protein [Bombella pollinis]MCX5619039.1 creatininase family protein [Bombella pollinis]
MSNRAMMWWGGLLAFWGVAFSAYAEGRVAEALPPACPPPAQQVELACQSWTELDAAFKQGVMTAILPIGGTEQSGPYMAVGKHNVRAQSLADEIARTLGHTMVAPVVAYVPEGGTQPRTGHMRFAGTLSIPPSVFAGLIEGAVESLRTQGFRTIVLLGDHGGYQTQLEGLARKVNKRWAAEGQLARVLYVGAYYDVIAQEYAPYLRQHGYGVALGKHADISDTSLMLAVDPSLVREGLLRQVGKPTPADGVYGGDPRQATAELGRVGIAMQVQAAVKAISSFNRRHP